MRRDLSSWLVNLRTFGRKAKYRRGNRSLQARRASVSISLAGGEQLDPRKMLAVTANLVGSGLAISLGASDDVAGLVYNTTTDEYDVYDKTTLVDSFKASGVTTIEVLDTAVGGGEDQVFEVRDGGTIAASLGVSDSVETTKIFDDISVTSADPIPGGFGVVIGSAKIILDDATLANPLAIGTNNTDIQFDGVVTLIGGTDAHINSGAGKGDINFLDDIFGGEGGAGTLTLTAGTGAISFGGDIGGTGVGEDLGGVLINSAASVSATGKFYLDGTIPTAYGSGIEIGDGVNNVNLPNGGYIAGFTKNGAAIYFAGDSTNSTIGGFLLGQSTYGLYAGGNAAEADLSGTVIDGNVLGQNDYGIYLDNVAGGLEGEDAFVIGGTTGNQIVQNGEDGIYAYSSVGVEISRNFLWFNGADGVDAGSGIRLEGGGEYLIADNSIGEDAGFGNSSDGITIDGEDGFYSYAGTVLFQNGILSNLKYGVRVQGVTADTGEDSILILSNDFINNGLNAEAPLDIGGVRIDGSENIRIISNYVGFSGEDQGNGIDIVNGSHGTIVFSNDIIENTGHGVYVENSSIVANPLRIGDILPTVSSTGSSVTVAGDQRAVIVQNQYVWLFYATDPTDIATVTVPDADGIEVLSVAYDSANDATTLTFASVAGAPAGVSLGNRISDNGEDGVIGHGIGVLATGEGEGGVVQGLEIIGNVVVGSGLDGMHLEATRAANNGDLSDIVIAGNFIGREPTASGGVGQDRGNFEDGIEVVNGDDFLIVSNYVAANGGAASDVNDYNGIEIRTSQYIDIGEDGLGNYIVRNANDGIDIKGSTFVNIVDNEIASNGEDGIQITAVEATRSQDILIENNWIHDNGARGISVRNADRVEITDNLIENNNDDGVSAIASTGVAVAFNIIRTQGANGVDFLATIGTVEGNEIYDNFGDGVHVDGEDAFNGIVDVLGNIIRENGDDGIEFRDGYYGYDLSEADEDGRQFSVVGGNTIERNVDDGVSLVNVGGLQVGGRFPSDINVINLNGAAGVCVSGVQPIDTPLVANGVSVLGNEIDSNEEYGVCLDGAEDVVVGAGFSYGEWDVYAGPDAANTIRRNGIAGVFAQGYSENAVLINNDISENPIGVMITSAYGPSGSWFSSVKGLQIGGPSYPAEDSEFGTLGNRVFDNGEGIRATGDCAGTVVAGNLIEGNLTGATLASVRGLTFGYGEDALPPLDYSNIVQNNNEGLRASGLLTGTSVAGNQFLDNSKVGIALQSARDLRVGGFDFGEDSANFIAGSPVGLSASGTMTDTLVSFNQFDANTVGIALSKATGMFVGGNEIANSLKYGISVTGNNADTLIIDNTITNTGDGPYAGSGIYLSNARSVEIIDNTVDGSSLAGLYATGNTSGTVVEGNLFTDNRIGMFLENASNAVFGGSDEGEDNTIIGGGDPLAGEFRDGILVVGGAPGSKITGTDITNASTGVWMRGSQGIEITDTFVTEAKFFGFNASGNLSGSSFHDNVITDTVGIAGGLGHAIHLEGAQNLALYSNLGEDSLGSGLYVTGDTAGTTVKLNELSGNRVGISLVNATNAVIGGPTADDANLVDGGSDAANGIYRDGIQVIGTSTGSSVSGVLVDNTTTGIVLENATGITLSGNNVDGAQFLGVNASGNLAGTSLTQNQILNSGGLGALGHGIYLANASNLNVTKNTINNSTGGGLYATGVTTGTKVQDNDFEGNRVGIYLVDATNAVIGGLSVGDANRIVGGGNASKGDFRDGILASGTLTGSNIKRVSITNAATGITLAAATGLAVATATVTGSQVYGLNANGLLTGTFVDLSEFSGTLTAAGGGAGVLLSAAQSFEIYDTDMINNAVGLLATGNCANSKVIDALWSGNTTDLINTSTGVPPLDIDPLP